MSAEIVRLHAPEPLPDFRREGLGWVWDAPNTLVTFRARHLKRSGGELWAEVEVRSGYPGGHRGLVRARYNLSIDSARTRLAGYLAKQHTAPVDVDWSRLVELFCVKVLDGETGTAGGFLLLGDMEEPEWQPDLVQKLVQAGQTTMLYGPQGEGKGWLVIGIAVCVTAGIPFCGLDVRRCKVLYLDWEADRWTFNRRVRAVCAGLGIPPVEVAWFKPRGPIGQEVDAVAEYVAREGIGLVIWDSIGHAGGNPDVRNGGYEGLALDVSAATDAMGEATAHIWVDHLNAEGIKEKIAGKAIGAIRKMADVRVAWEVRKAQEEDSDSYSVGLFHTKHNNTMKYSPLGFRLAFRSDQHGRATRVTFEREDVRRTDNAERLSDPARFEIALQQARRALSTRELADALGMTQAQVRTIGGRLVTRGRVLRFDSSNTGGKSQFWGLKATATPQPPLSTPPVAVGSAGADRNTASLQPQQTATVAVSGGRLPYADDSEELDDAPF